MSTKKQIKRAVEIATKCAATEGERRAIRAAFALLFWNEPGFNPAAFKAECDAAAARAKVAA